MRRSAFAQEIELLLQQFIHGAIQRERKARRPVHAQAPVEIEASRALHVELDPRAAQGANGFALAGS
jgi:hypothetical protein